MSCGLIVTQHMKSIEGKHSVHLPGTDRYTVIYDPFYSEEVIGVNIQNLNTLLWFK